MTSGDVLALFEFCEWLAADRQGRPLEPVEREEVRDQVSRFVAPLLDWEARMRILVRTDALDVAMGKAVLLEDGTVWRGEETG